MPSHGYHHGWTTVHHLHGTVDVATCSSLIRSTEFTGLLIGALGGYNFQHYGDTGIFYTGLTDYLLLITATPFKQPCCLFDEVVSDTNLHGMEISPLK